VLGGRGRLGDETGPPGLHPRSVTVAAHLQPESEQPRYRIPNDHISIGHNDPLHCGHGPNAQERASSQETDAAARHCTTERVSHRRPVPRPDAPLRARSDRYHRTLKITVRSFVSQMCRDHP
jgi:hypothetical protein